MNQLCSTAWELEQHTGIGVSVTTPPGLPGPCESSRQKVAQNYPKSSQPNFLCFYEVTVMSTSASAKRIIPPYGTLNSTMVFGRRGGGLTTNNVHNSTFYTNSASIHVATWPQRKSFHSSWTRPYSSTAKRLMLANAIYFLEYEVEDARPRGRPKKTWTEIVQREG